MQNLNLHVLLCAVAISSAPLLATAAEHPDKRQAIEIAADSVRLEQDKHHSFFKGHVKFQQGSLRLEGDQIEVTAATKNMGQKFRMAGKPAQFQQRGLDNNLLTGSANRIIYDADAETIEFLGQAILCHKGEFFRAEKILYHTGDLSIQADGTQKLGGRVVVTLSEPAASTNCESIL